MYKPVIAVTVGDPSGIGPEIVKKAVSSKAILKVCKPVVIGTSKGYVAGKHTKNSDKAAISFIDKSLDLLRLGEADALVTAPVSKSAFGDIGGHTEYISKLFLVKKFEMLMLAEELKVLLLTRHIPLKDVVKNLNAKKILESIVFTSNFIKEKFNIKNPEIAVCGLNPHCGDNGLVGKEEQEIIIPALKKLKKYGFNIKGPVNPEIAFKKNKYDFIVCMYHDQAMLPLKILKPNNIVNLTVGLPFIRTSPGHGTGYDIAGKGRANPKSMIEAIKLACRLTENAPSPDAWHRGIRAAKQF
ncbi:MAG: hypothetical protein A2539_04300 [Elusimicrobia bacterium RIFOXYD2_FULL_34_15]|nr:MAG: hypothetical protein A2539_04300 [Elusimicrobia bacterium RIFOXYD2_FULL_34_15]